MADLDDDDIEYSVELSNITGDKGKVPVTADDPDIHALLPKVLAARVFTEWLEKIEKDPLLFVKNVLVQSVDMFGPRVGFIKFKAAAQLNVGGEEGVLDVPGIVFMRGGAVGVLVILECDGKEYSILTYQARVPVGIHNLPEIPAGMLDGSGNFKGVAAEEIAEECNIVISENELIDLTGMAYGEKWQGILPSAGGCDEFIRLYMFRRVVTSDVLSELEGRLTGYMTMHTTEVDPVNCKPVSAFFRSAALSLLYADSLQTVLPDRYAHTFKRLRQEGERIKLHIVPLEDMWKMTPDAKADLQQQPQDESSGGTPSDNSTTATGAEAGQVEKGLSEDGLAQLAAINEAEGGGGKGGVELLPGIRGKEGQGGSGGGSEVGSDVAGSSRSVKKSVRENEKSLVNYDTYNLHYLNGTTHQPRNANRPSSLGGDSSQSTGHIGSYGSAGSGGVGGPGFSSRHAGRLHSNQQGKRRTSTRQTIKDMTQAMQDKDVEILSLREQVADLLRERESSKLSMSRTARAADILKAENDLLKESSSGVHAGDATAAP